MSLLFYSQQNKSMFNKNVLKVVFCTLFRYISAHELLVDDASQKIHQVFYQYAWF